MGIITLVCHSFGVLLEHQASYDIRVSQGTHSRFKALSISSWISSQPAAFSAFIFLTARKTSAAVLIFSFPKCTFCVSDDLEVLSLKEILGILSLSARDVLLIAEQGKFWSLINLVLLDFLPCWRRVDARTLCWHASNWSLVYARNTLRIAFLTFPRDGCLLFAPEHTTYAKKSWLLSEATSCRLFSSFK